MVSGNRPTTDRSIVLLVWGRGIWPPHVLRLLNLKRYIVHEAFSAKDARDALSANKIDIVIADLHLRDDNGFSFARRAKELSPETEVRLAASFASAVKIANGLGTEVSRDGRRTSRREHDQVKRIWSPTMARRIP